MTFAPWRRSSLATNVRRGAKVGETSYPWCLVKRSWYRIANWFIAAFQLCAARLQSAVMLRSASQTSLLAARIRPPGPAGRQYAPLRTYLAVPFVFVLSRYVCHFFFIRKSLYDQILK